LVELENLERMKAKKKAELGGLNQRTAIAIPVFWTSRTIRQDR